jgi:hypothetical protein
MNIFNTIANHPFASIGVIGLILAFFRVKVRQYILMALSRVAFVFVRRTYLHKSLGDAFVAYLLRNGYNVKRFSGELYGEDPAFIRSENDVKHVLYKDVNSNTQIFYPQGGIFKDWPIFLSGTPLIQSKDTVKNYAYIVYTPRWSKKYIALLDAATELKNSKDDEPELNQFVVKHVSGTGKGTANFLIEKDRSLKGGPGKEDTTATEAELADPFSTLIPVKWDKDNIGQLIYHNSLEMMSLNQELEDVLEEIKFWLEHQEWYEERGIPWKRGFLFYGKPGTGKTMFTRALAEKLNLPLLIFDLASMDSNEFRHAWSQLLPRRIALFEDFDSVFIKRTNVHDSGLDFSTVLNALDGADKKQGVLTIITTNYPEKLDFALGGPIDGVVKKAKDRFVILDKDNGKVADTNGGIGYASEEAALNALKFNGGKMPSRPGRIDRSVEFVPLDKPGRLKLAMRIMKDDKLAEKMVEEGAHDSAAQLQERCFRTALELLFNKKAA